MEIQEYIKQKKDIYNILLEYIDCENDEDDEEKYQDLIKKLNEHSTLESYDRIREFLILINKLSKYHYRNQYFMNRIERIITFFEDKIKQIFTNLQLFNIFINNKRLLLYLFNKNIINADQNIIQIIFQPNENKYETYKYYFYNEIKNEISSLNQKDIEDNLLKMDSNIFENFQEKCKIGENDSYLCSLIRNDLIDDFIPYVTKKNISLKSVINPSIFETNFLLETRNPSLIEYSAFYGAIQIFQFLRLNDVEMNSNLWLYAIHGRNPEIIHLLEDDHIDVEFNKILEESIKCHHNEIANYFEDAYFINTNEKQNPLKKVFNFIKNKVPNHVIENKVEFKIKEEMGFKYHNYEFIPNDFNNEYLFKFFCEYDHITFCKLFLKNDVIEINERFVNLKFFFISTLKKLIFCMEFISI